MSFLYYFRSTRGGRKPAEKDLNKHKSAEEDSQTDESSNKVKQKDDHGKHKNLKRPKHQDSSSDDDNEPLVKPTRSQRASKDRQQNSKKSKCDEKSSEMRNDVSPRSSSRGKDKSKSNSLKIRININKSEVINGDECISSASDSSSSGKKEVEDTSSKDDSSNSDSGDEEKQEVIEENQEGDKLPICNQKLRNRQKYETNKDFNKLKELIKERKSKRGNSYDIDVTKESMKKNEEKENLQTNGGEQSSSDHELIKKNISSVNNINFSSCV